MQAGTLSGFLVAGTTVTFQSDGQRTAGPVSFRSDGKRFLVTDLAEGAWRVARDGAAAGKAIEVSKDAGTLWFEGPPGRYTLERTKSK
jgi:hypothetical protein